MAAVARMDTLSQAIKKDHREMESHHHIITQSKDSDERTRYQNELTWRLARYSVAEELVICPAFEKYLSDGSRLSEKIRNQHRIVKDQLSEFQDVNESDPKFDPLLNDLMKDLDNHIIDEETNDIPKLEDALSTAESQELAREFERTKMFVPSRSHPVFPDKPPFETALSLMTAPIDRLGDMFRRFPIENRTSNTATHAGLS